MTYLPFDQDERLGPPPWSPDDPALLAWEDAHNHGARLKCYVENGCAAIDNQVEMLEDQLERWQRVGETLRRLHAAVTEAAAALDGLADLFKDDERLQDA